jgi:hypothetical protein
MRATRRTPGSSLARHRSPAKSQSRRMQRAATTRWGRGATRLAAFRLSPGFRSRCSADRWLGWIIGPRVRHQARRGLRSEACWDGIWTSRVIADEDEDPEGLTRFGGFRRVENELGSALPRSLNRSTFRPRSSCESPAGYCPARACRTESTSQNIWRTCD